MTLRGGIKLYDYQEETLERMMKLEDADSPNIPLTEPFGSGKTLIILALIMRRPIPHMSYADLSMESAATKATVIARPNQPNGIIRPTAIIVARSVYAQWLKISII